jgi:hypothetical protein
MKLIKKIIAVKSSRIKTQAIANPKSAIPQISATSVVDTYEQEKIEIRELLSDINHKSTRRKLRDLLTKYAGEEKIELVKLILESSFDTIIDKPHKKYGQRFLYRLPFHGVENVLLDHMLVTSYMDIIKQHLLQEIKLKVIQDETAPKYLQEVLMEDAESVFS